MWFHIKDWIYVKFWFGLSISIVSRSWRTHKIPPSLLSSILRIPRDWLFSSDNVMLQLAKRHQSQVNSLAHIDLVQVRYTSGDSMSQPGLCNSKSCTWRAWWICGCVDQRWMPYCLGWDQPKTSIFTNSLKGENECGGWSSFGRMLA